MNVRLTLARVVRSRKKQEKVKTTAASVGTLHLVRTFSFFLRNHRLASERSYQQHAIQ